MKGREMREFRGQLEVASRRLGDSVARVRELGALPQDDTARAALYFHLERAAWAMIEMAAGWVFELRLGIARKESENFDLLQRHGWLELETARKLKQLCELRNLSARESDRIDAAYLSGGLPEELGLLTAWNTRALAWPPAEGGA